MAPAIGENFIMMKVNYSEENKNDEFLSQFPQDARLSALVRARWRRQVVALARHGGAGSG